MKDLKELNDIEFESKLIIDFYEKYVSDIEIDKNHDYYPKEYNKYFDKYDEDILKTHCHTIVKHHLDISSYMRDLYDNEQLILIHTERQNKKNKNIFYIFFQKIKSCTLTFICSQLFADILFLSVFGGYGLRAFIVDNVFNIFVALALFLAATNIYSIFKMIVDINIKKTKKFTDYSFYKPVNKIETLANLKNTIFEKFYTFLTSSSSIPERKLLEIMRKHPCMYNDKDFLSLCLMAQQNIAMFEDAENIVMPNNIETLDVVL